MAISTYAELQSAVGDFLNRQDLTTVIPTFIALAEADLNRSIRHRSMLTRSTATIDSQFTALPTDFLGSQEHPVEQRTNHRTPVRDDGTR